MFKTLSTASSSASWDDISSRPSWRGELGGTRTSTTGIVPGWQTFQERFEELLEAKNEGCTVRWSLEEQLDNAVKGKYKGREVKGTLLHYAIDRDSEEKKRFAECAKLVLEAKAQVDSQLEFKSFDKKNRVGFAPALGRVQELTRSHQDLGRTQSQREQQVLG